MSRILILIVTVFFSALQASATTWYIRTDGGPSYACTGTTNAAYTGTTNNTWTPSTVLALGYTILDGNGHYESVTTAGTTGSGYPPTWGSATTTDGTVTWTEGAAYPAGVACALNHPFWLLNQSTWTWNTAANDSVQFEDVGPYYIGQYNPASGRGIWWPYCHSNEPNCAFPVPMPSGTKFYGVSVGNCHQTDVHMAGAPSLISAWSGHGALLNPTQLVGINGVFYILDLQSATAPDVECFDITQATQCTSFGNTYTHCSGPGVDDYATHGIFLEYQTAQGPTDAVLKDIAIHGLASEGISGGHLNTSSGDTFTADDIYIMGNGSAGWDWDGGGCGTSCENVGTMNIDWLRIEWNGCIEVKGGSYIGQDGYTNCADDSNGGYGDGWAMIATQGAWTVNHGLFRWNTQDGFDSLHTSDDLAHPPTSLVVENSWSEGNEGQTFKLGFSSDSLAQNNVSISNCQRLAAAFPPNPTGYNTDLSDFCRAAGDQWVFVISDSALGPTKVIHNTSVGYGATMYDIECDGTCTTSTQMQFQDNISVGYLNPTTSVLAGGIYLGASVSDPFSNPGSSIDYNDWYSMKSGICPQDAAETSYICANPTLADASIDSINPALLSGSPAIGAGLTIAGQITDFTGTNWLNPPSMGALETTGPITPHFAPSVPLMLALLLEGPSRGTVTGAMTEAQSTVCWQIN